LVLQRALETEVDDFLGRGHYQRSEDKILRGYRNGYEPKNVHMGEGTVELQVPQIRDSLEPFESVWLKSIGKRSKRLLELIPMLYVKGMGQRDIEAALIEALDVNQTGRSVINEVCKSLRVDFQKWQERDLSQHRILYLFLDGIYLKLRPEDKRAVAVLCAYGMQWNGRKVLLHLALGDKESTACWEAFLEDMKSRGVNEPVLTIIDGNSGLRKAVGRKLPNSLVRTFLISKILINTGICQESSSPRMFLLPILLKMWFLNRPSFSMLCYAKTYVYSLCSSARRGPGFLCIQITLVASGFNQVAPKGNFSSLSLVPDP